MNTLMDHSEITELSCGENFTYILNSNDAFAPTEYKVLQSQSDGPFVKCMKLTYNGKIQLYYLVSGLMSFGEILPSLDPEKFGIIVADLFAGATAVRNNGFLSCQNIDLSLEHIYVDSSTYKINFIYLPVTKRLFTDFFAFESRLRACIVKSIQSFPSLSSSKTGQLLADLTNGSLPFEELIGKVRSNLCISTYAEAKKPIGMLNHNASKIGGRIKIVAINAPVPFEITVDRDEFVLGRKQGVADGVISFNRMIGRAHCKILKGRGNYAVVDLGSANGTYVNDIRLQPNQPYPIKDGDTIRLANSEFQIIIG